MTAGTTRTAAFPRSLAALRWRLTAWYVGTFFAILALLGIGLWVCLSLPLGLFVGRGLRSDGPSIGGPAAPPLVFSRSERDSAEHASVHRAS